MSLKAKVEAIIYAAEEPITVEQIAQLLRDQILAEAARLEAEAQAAAEANAAEDAQNNAEADTAVIEEASSTEAAGPATTEENNPTLSVTEQDEVSAEPDPQVRSASLREPGAPDAEVPESAEAAEASTPAADESAPVETAAENPAVEDIAETEASTGEPAHMVETGVEQTVPEAATDVAETAPIEVASDEPAPAESASVDAPAAPGKRQKKTKEEIAVDAKVRARVRVLIAELIADYANEERGIEVRPVAGGYRMSTKPEHHDVVRAFAKSLKPPVRLSLAALETLAVIAYKQPITVPEISEIRGVESGGVIATLLDRKLITTAGRKQVIGRPILYKTGKEFLLRFGLNDVSELPSMEEFEKLAAEGLGGGEEQTSFDLQPQASEKNLVPEVEDSDVEAATPLKPEEGLNGAQSDAASAEEPAATGDAENAAEQQESAPADENQPATQAEEPQHS